MARYADQPTVSVSADVAASPSTLWPLITDINLPARFSDEFQGAEWIAPATGPTLGAQFEGRNENQFIGAWTVICSVAVYEPEVAFGWEPGGPDAPFARWRLSLEPHGATTTLTFWAQMGLGPSGLTPMLEADPDREEALVDYRLSGWVENMQRTIDGIKALAESAD